MHTTIHPLYAPPWIEAARAAGREARAMAEALHAAFRRWQAQRALDTLDTFDGRLLRDLGLDRSDIGSITAQPADAERLLTWRSPW